MFDIAFTSVLKRAIHTLWLALETMDAMHTPVEKCWRLNERHYGALQVRACVALHCAGRVPPLVAVVSCHFVWW